jgi:hypothetical protein
MYVTNHLLPGEINKFEFRPFLQKRFKKDKIALTFAHNIGKKCIYIKMIVGKSYIRIHQVTRLAFF